MFRAVDLIGQVLKSYYGSIRNADKVQMLEAAIDGPLRGLAALFEVINVDPEALLRDLELVFEKQHKKLSVSERQTLARQAAFNFLALMSTAFVSKAARAVGAAELLTITREVTDRSPSTARKLMEMAIRLESSGELPIKAVETMAGDLERKPVALRVLQALVIKHMTCPPGLVRFRSGICRLI